jgi:hypothetical protein
VSCRGGACCGIRRASPVDCRHQRNTFLTNWLQIEKYPCSAGF